MKGTAPEAQIAQSPSILGGQRARRRTLQEHHRTLSPAGEASCTGRHGCRRTGCQRHPGADAAVGTPASAAKPAATPGAPPPVRRLPRPHRVLHQPRQPGHPLLRLRSNRPPPRCPPLLQRPPAAPDHQPRQPPRRASPANPASASRATASAPTVASPTAASPTAASSTAGSPTAASPVASASTPAAPASAGGAGPAVVALAAVSPPKSPASAVQARHNPSTCCG